MVGTSLNSIHRSSLVDICRDLYQQKDRFNTTLSVVSGRLDFIIHHILKATHLTLSNHLPPLLILLQKLPLPHPLLPNRHPAGPNLQKRILTSIRNKILLQKLPAVCVCTCPGCFHLCDGLV